MNDLILYGLPFVAGIILGAIFWRNRSGPFESVIMANLKAGKKVIISIDNDAYIFEMNGNRMRISLGVARIMEEVEHVDNLDGLDILKSDDDSVSRH